LENDYGSDLKKHGVSENDLVNFPGSHYSDPVFSWLNPVAVTAIEFLKSTKLGLGLFIQSAFRERLRQLQLRIEEQDRIIRIIKGIKK
jgi:hypothetical protein